MKLSRERKVYAAVLGLAALILGADRFILGGATFAPGAAAAAAGAPSTDTSAYALAPNAPTSADAEGPSLANRLQALLPEPPPPVYPRPTSLSWRLAHPNELLLPWSNTTKGPQPRGLFCSSAPWLIPADLEAVATTPADPDSKARSLSDILARHRITSVVTGAKPFVIIDGSPVALGKTLDGVKVVRIERATRTTPAAVTFERAGEKLRVEIR